jgi:hypothetical protein
MTTEPTFVRLLKNDAAHHREMAKNWEELEKEGVFRFEDTDGNTSSPAQMAAKYRARAEELEELIAKFQPK